MPPTSTSTVQAWLEDRRTRGIGASDAPIILGVSRFKSAYSLYHEKRGARPIEPHDQQLVQLGLLMEPIIAQLFATETGRVVREPRSRYELQVHPERPWMFATIDRWQWDDTRVPPLSAGLGADELVAAGTGVLELKNVSVYAAKTWLDTGEVPLEYQLQLQHQLAATGCAWGSIAALIGGTEFRWADFERDDDLIGGIITEEEAFWQRVLAGDEPIELAADAHDSTRETLNGLFTARADEPRSVTGLAPELLDVDATRQEAIERIKFYEDRRAEAENRILAELQAAGASVGVFSNGVRYEWTMRSRTTKPQAEAKTVTFPVLTRKAPK